MPRARVVQVSSDQLTLEAESETVSMRSSRSDTKRPDQAPASARRPLAEELLETPGALLTRSHLRELGLERRAIDAVFRKLPVVALPGYSRPMVHAKEYVQLIDEHTYRDDRVRPSHA